VRPVGVEAETAGTVTPQLIDLAKRPGVEEQVQPFADGELALAVLLFGLYG